MTLHFLAAAAIIGLLGMVAENAGRADHTPFFCNLNALTNAERSEHHRVTALLLVAITSVRELSNGYRLTVDKRGLSIADLTAFVDFERRCCPFFNIQLEWGRDNGPVTFN